MDNSTTEWFVMFCLLVISAKCRSILIASLFLLRKSDLVHGLYNQTNCKMLQTKFCCYSIILSMWHPPCRIKNTFPLHYVAVVTILTQLVHGLSISVLFQNHQQVVLQVQQRRISCRYNRSLGAEKQHPSCGKISKNLYMSGVYIFCANEAAHMHHMP